MERHSFLDPWWPPEEDLKGANRLSVLIVDDNAMFREMVRRFLAESAAPFLEVAGFAENGDDAVSKAAELRPDVILMDLNMPGTPAIRVLPLLRQRFPKTAVIILTLLDPGEYRRVALSAGAQGFVAKSALRTQLIPTIRQAA